jgi:tRNA nucleotidyltransferase (CCA-adding enzyme)
LPLAAAEAVMDRLKVRRTTREDYSAFVRLLQAATRLPAAPRPSQVVTAFGSFPPRVILAARAALGDDARLAALLEQFQREWRHVRQALNGDHLVQMGLKPGPRLGQILHRLQQARLDGEVADEAGERRLVEELLAEG